MKEEQVAKLHKLIDKFTKKVKGISVALTDKDNTIFEYCTGVIDESDTPNDSSKMYSIGSNTKLLTAIGIFQQIDRGKLELDEDIKTYIPEFSIRSHFPFEKITTRQLLMHRSGLLGDDYRLFLDENRTMANDLLPVLKETYLCTQPGTMYAYSNLAYGLLGLIIERLSGETYIEYLEKNIFKPLGLSMRILETFDKKNQYTGIISKGFNKKRRVNDYDLTTLISAGSSTYSTIGDMSTLLRYFLNPEKQTILSQKSINQLLAPPPEGMYEKGESCHGLGVMHNVLNYTDEHIGSVVGHGGATLYHFSVFLMIPKLGIGVTVMSNTTGGNVKNSLIANELLVEYMKSINIEVDPIKMTDVPLVTRDVSALAETYINIGLKIPITLHKNNILRTKIEFMKANVDVHEDGTYTLSPRGIAKLPPFKKLLKKMILNVREIDKQRILYFTKYSKYTYSRSAIACILRPIDNIDKYQHLVGKYKCISKFEGHDKFGSKSSVTIKNQALILRTNLEGTNIKFRLFPVDETHFVVQGYGRYSYSTVTITEQNSKPVFTLCGISGIKQ
ncbi:beta-lactamase family protein [Candidatus Izimaplasma bacterium]|nr:beta-lactamase family protein [Candidatus Izimaplasma bacterium]